MREGGREEWEAVRSIARKPKNPASGVAAMSCMGATRDIELAKATFQYMMTEARDQDVYYFFGGLQANIVTRRYLTEAFKENYDKVRGSRAFSMR